MTVMHKSLGICLFLATLVTNVSAQHSDIFVYQANGMLVPTDGSNQQFVFSRLFDFFGHPFGNTGLPKAFIADDPGVQTNDSPPNGFSELPVGATLSGDFLPFQIPGDVSANVLHWNPSDGDVAFQPVAAGHSFEVTDVAGNGGFVLDGSLSSVNNVLLGLVSSANEIHEHISWRLDDGDGNASTEPQRGVYLMMMQMNVGDMESDPFAILLNSTDISVAEQDSATDWVASNIDAFTIPGDTLPGDFDGNGTFDLVDIDQLVAAVASASSASGFDVNGDGAVDYADVTSWLAIAGSANLPSAASFMVGDANLDGFVDVSDFNRWNINNTTSGGAWSRADFNADGAVNNVDFNLWNVNKFQTPSGAQFVPEPNAMVLVCWLPLAGLCIVRRFRRGKR